MNSSQMGAKQHQEGPPRSHIEWSLADSQDLAQREEGGKGSELGSALDTENAWPQWYGDAAAPSSSWLCLVHDTDCEVLTTLVFTPLFTELCSSAAHTCCSWALSELLISLNPHSHSVIPFSRKVQ